MEITTLEILKSLEKKYNFNYPGLYMQLCKDGMLNMKAPSAEKGLSLYQLLKQNPPLLLFGNDFELLDPSDVEEHLESITDTDYPRFNPDLKFIPFGTSGAGDWICFYFNEKQGEDIPIAFVWHDNNDFDIKAKNLQDYMFREMLDGLTELNEYSRLYDDFETNKINYQRTHCKYLSDKQKEIVEKYYNSPMKEYSYKSPNGKVTTTTGTLTHEEFDKLIKENIDFPLLDKSIPLF